MILIMVMDISKVMVMITRKTTTLGMIIVTFMPFGSHVHSLVSDITEFTVGDGKISNLF
jgi:hypothetical protein